MIPILIIFVPFFCRSGRGTKPDILIVSIKSGSVPLPDLRKNGILSISNGIITLTMQVNSLTKSETLMKEEARNDKSDWFLPKDVKSKYTGKSIYDNTINYS